MIKIVNAVALLFSKGKVTVVKGIADIDISILELAFHRFGMAVIIVIQITPLF